MACKCGVYTGGFVTPAITLEEGRRTIELPAKCVAAPARTFGDPSVASGKFLFTSEAVSMGHPDKLADQISDGVLDALFAQDPYSRVACETMVTTGLCVIAGEVTTKATVDMQQVVPAQRASAILRPQ